MKCFLPAGIISVLAFSMIYASLALAQTPPGETVEGQISPNDKIKISYIPPTKAELVPLYERLRGRKVLESIQQFLAPLVLTQEIEVSFEQCGGPNLLYKPKGPATICYEYVDQIERMAPKSELVELAQGPVTRENAIVGPVVQAILRQTALAIFDSLDIPVWGRREDAADRVAAFIMLQFGPDVAWNTIVGSAWFLAGSASSPPDFADVRGTVAQRYYTMLCIAIGSPWLTSQNEQPFASFYKIEAAGSLTRERASNCHNEYELLKLGFDATIAPHVNPALLELVRSRPIKWIGFGE